jgi:hypothetical protein
MHLLAERFVFLRVMMEGFLEESQDVSDGTIVAC